MTAAGLSVTAGRAQCDSDGARGYYCLTPEFTPQEAEEYPMVLHVKRDKSQLSFTPSRKT